MSVAAGRRLFAAALAFWLTCGALSARAQVEDFAVVNAQVDKLSQAGDYAAAVPIAQRALVLVERQRGQDNIAIGTALHNLAALYEAQGQYALAEPLYVRLSEILKKALGPDEASVGTALSTLAGLYKAQGKYELAEPLYQQALAIREKAPGGPSPLLGRALSNLAGLYVAQGKLALAEPLYQRALAVNENAWGQDHPSLNGSLNDLANLYEAQGRHELAEPLYQRSLALSDKAPAPSLTMAEALTGLGGLYTAQGKYALAEPLYKRALTISEAALGSDHLDVGTLLNNVAVLNKAQGRTEETEPLYKRAIAIYEKALGPDHARVATLLGNLAALYESQAEFELAQPLYQRALAIREKTLGSEHLEVGAALWSLAALAQDQGATATALVNQRRASAILKERTLDETETDALALHKQVFRFHVAVAGRARDAGEPPPDGEALKNESFEAAQQARMADLALPLARIRDRLATGDSALAQALRSQRDLVRQRQEAEARLNSASAGNADGNEGPQAAIATLQRKVDDADQAIASQFPFYAQMLRPRALGITSVQAALTEGEVLVVFLDVPSRGLLAEATYAWAVTKADSRWLKLALAPSEISSHVAALRCGLDPGLWTGESAGRCRDLVKVEPARSASGVVHSDTLPFDRARAQALYTALFGPFADLLKDRSLIVVPDGALTRLPVGVLMVDDTTWLGAQQAITVLPSVAALQALRTSVAGSGSPTQPLLIVGSERPPIDDGSLALAERAEIRHVCASRTPSAAAEQDPPPSERDQPAVGVSDRHEALADAEPSGEFAELPDAAEEACAIARRLGAGDEVDVLEGRDSEEKLKALSETGALARYAMLYFTARNRSEAEADHAREPGLLLGPPSQDSRDGGAVHGDDGVLTPSELATLKLDADWVIASPFNSSPDGVIDGGRAMLDLALALSYAGSRALLASHWPVDEEAGATLLKGTFVRLKDHPEIGRAEALRHAIASMITTTHSHLSHPANWGAYSLLGDGGPPGGAPPALPVRAQQEAEADPDHELAPQPYKLEAGPPSAANPLARSESGSASATSETTATTLDPAARSSPDGARSPETGVAASDHKAASQDLAPTSATPAENTVEAATPETPKKRKRKKAKKDFDPNWATKIFQ